MGPFWTYDRYMPCTVGLTRNGCVASLYSYLAFLDLRRNKPLLDAHKVEVEYVHCSYITCLISQ